MLGGNVKFELSPRDGPLRLPPDAERGGKVKVITVSLSSGKVMLKKNSKNLLPFNH